MRDTAGVSPGRFCRRPDPGDPTLAACDFGELAAGQEGLGRGEARVALGDGDDRARLEGSGIPGGAYAPGGEFDGGPGNDVLIGGSGSNRFDGGPGDDYIDAGLGCGEGGLIDEGSAPNGSDTFTGRGVVSYARRTASLEASLDGRRNDGEAGEQDKIGRSVDVVGGEGDDLLVGNRSPNRLAGGGGSDELRGGAGPDVLSAAALTSDGFGAARAVGGGADSTADRLHGGNGDDALTGSAGPNVLEGGRGEDTLSGLGGPDLLVTADRSADVLRCGRGLDRSRMDGRDFFRSTTAQRCERTSRSVPGVAAELGGVRSLQTSGLVGDKRSAQIAVACPGDAPVRCRGVVRLAIAGRTLGRARFAVPRNRTKTVTVRMTRSGRRLIVRRSTVTAVAVVRSRDRRGRTRETRVGGNRIWSESPDDSGGGQDQFDC